MDKPTTPNPADLGVLIPGTEEYKRATEALEANQKAEQADPELARRHRREEADQEAVYARFLMQNPYEAVRLEKLIRDARKYAESYLGEARSSEARLIVTRRIWNEFIPESLKGKESRLEFGSLHKAIWTEGDLSPEGYLSLEERAQRAAEGGFPKMEPARERIAEGAMDLPELPQEFQNAFEAKRAKAELEYVNRAEAFPHHPQFAESGLQPLIRIQTVFFAFCTEARNACREGDWTVARVSQSVDTVWPLICDSYFRREHGTCSEQERVRFRVALWRTVTDDPRWKQHLSDLAALADAATSVPRATRVAAGRPGEDPAQRIAEGATPMGRPSRYEIEKFANDAFAIARDRILTEYAKKQGRVLGQVRLTGNSGGYLPALTKWGAERVREMILAQVDAYVEAFTLRGMPTDARAERDLQAAAQQIAAGTVSAICGELDIESTRTQKPRNHPWGHLNREIEAAMKSALKEGVLRLKRQRINASEGRDMPRRGDLLEKLLQGDQSKRAKARSDWLDQNLIDELWAADTETATSFGASDDTSTDQLQVRPLSEQHDRAGTEGFVDAKADPALGVADADDISHAGGDSCAPSQGPNLGVEEGLGGDKKTKRTVRLVNLPLQKPLGKVPMGMIATNPGIQKLVAERPGILPYVSLIAHLEKAQAEAEVAFRKRETTEDWASWPGVHPWDDKPDLETTDCPWWVAGAAYLFCLAAEWRKQFPAKPERTRELLPAQVRLLAKPVYHNKVFFHDAVNSKNPKADDLFGDRNAERFANFAFLFAMKKFAEGDLSEWEQRAAQTAGAITDLEAGRSGARPAASVSDPSKVAAQEDPIGGKAGRNDCNASPPKEGLTAGTRTELPADLPVKDATVNLLERILEKRPTTLEKWAAEHKFGRTTVFDWKSLRSAGKPIVGKVSTEKSAAIEEAIHQDGKALGLMHSD